MLSTGETCSTKRLPVLLSRPARLTSEKNSQPSIPPLSTQAVAQPRIESCCASGTGTINGALPNCYSTICDCAEFGRLSLNLTFSPKRRESIRLLSFFMKSPKHHRHGLPPRQPKILPLLEERAGVRTSFSLRRSRKNSPLGNTPSRRSPGNSSPQFFIGTVDESE